MHSPVPVTVLSHITAELCRDWDQIEHYLCATLTLPCVPRGLWASCPVKMGRYSCGVSKITVPARFIYSLKVGIYVYTHTSMNYVLNLKSRAVPVFPSWLNSAHRGRFCPLITVSVISSVMRCHPPGFTSTACRGQCAGPGGASQVL